MITNCACGVTYNPADASAKRRHEASAKHLAAIPQVAAAEAFDDLDLDDVPAPGVEPSKATKSKPKKAIVPKVVNVGEHKVCRVCGNDKPLVEYRKKSSRPDGRDTLCIDCAKAWTVAHRAKQAAAK